jgi:hypothetical protein
MHVVNGEAGFRFLHRRSGADNRSTMIVANGQASLRRIRTLALKSLNGRFSFHDRGARKLEC